MDITIDRGIIHKRRLKKVLSCGVAAVVVLAGFTLFRTILKPSIRLDQIRTAVVDQGPVSAQIQATGTVVPYKIQFLISPINSSIEEVYRPIGSAVNRGDNILRLNSKEINLEIQRLENEIQLKELEIEGTVQSQQRRIKKHQDKKDMLALDLKQKRTVLVNYQKLYETNTVSKFDLDKAQLEVDKIELQFNQLSREIADSKNEDENLLEQFKIQLKLLSQQLVKQSNLREDATIRANTSGVITGLTDQIGENITTGQKLAEISDLSNYRVDATLSDYHSQTVREGMAATVLYGTNQIDGKISKVLPSVEQGALNLEIQLSQADTTSLKLNQRVDVQIITQHKSSALRVKNGSAFSGPGKQYAFVVNDTSAATRRLIEVGLMDSQHVEIINGLSLGEKIIISDVSEYDNIEHIAIH